MNIVLEVLFETKVFCQQILSINFHYTKSLRQTTISSHQLSHDSKMNILRTGLPKRPENRVM